MSNETDYDAIVQRMAQQKDAQIGNSVYNASEINPDKAAKTQEMARTTGLPPQTVLNEYDDIVRRLKTSQAVASVSSTPVLAQHLTDQNTANIMHDDIPNASGIEQALRTQKPAQNGLLADIGVGLKSSANQIFGALGNSLGHMSVLEGVNNYAKSLGLKDGLGLSEYLQEAQKPLDDAYTKSLRDGAVNAPNRWTGNLASGLAYAPFGPAAPGVAALTSKEEAKQSLTDQGVDAQTAEGVSNAQGIVQGGAFLLPMGQFAFGAGARALAKSAAQAAVKSGAAGAGQSIIGDSVAQQILEKNGYGDLAKQYAPTFEKAWDSALFMAGAHLGMQGVHGVLTRRPPMPAELVQKAIDIDKSEHETQVLNTVLDGATTSKWRMRDPAFESSFKGFVGDAAEGTGRENIYVDGKTFEQALDKEGISPDELRSLMPEVAKQMNESLQTDGFLQIPTKEYSHVLAGTDLDKSVRKHLKFDPSLKSEAEIEAAYREYKDEMVADASREINQQSTIDEFQASRDRVRDQVQKELAATGRYPSDIGKTNATIKAAIVARIAAAEGISPEEAYKRHGAKIVSEPIKGGFEQSSEGPFGKIFTEHHHDVEGAIASLSKEKGGEAVGALHHPKIGDIDLVWGKEGKNEHDGYGLSKLLKWHPEVVGDLQNIVASMDITKQSENRINLESKDHKAGVRLQWDGVSKKWLLTAFEKDKKSGESKPSTDMSDIGKEDDSLPNATDAIVEQDLNKYYQSKGARGSYEPESKTIAILKDADLSTFNHEVGHWALDTYSRLASDNPVIKGEMDHLLKWFGVDSLEKWNGMSLDEQRPYHEQFAKGFETYLMEGKAPSIELQPIFARIKQWMISVYQSLDKLGVPLTDEVRGVYQRMMASEEAIRQAESARVFEPLFKDKPEGVSDSEWSEYQSLGQEATDQAVSEMQAKSLRDMQLLSNSKVRVTKGLVKEANTWRKEIQEQVEKEVAQEPIEQAKRWLLKGERTLENGEEVKATKGFKFNSEDVKELFPESALDRPDLGKLKGLTEKDGLHPDLVADIFGFNSGERLIRELISDEGTESKVEGLTDRRMLEQHGELATPQAIDDAANAAIHNDARARFVATGLKVLAKSAIPVRDLVKGAKEAAESAIGTKAIKDISPRQYEVAEAKTNRQALKDVAKDPKAAVEAQRASLLNNQLARAAREANVYEAKWVTYLKKFEKESFVKRLDKEDRDAIYAVLARFDFRQKIPDGKTPEKARYDAWVQSQVDAGMTPLEDPTVLNTDVAMHYKDMTLDQFKGLVDTVRSMEKIARERKLVTVEGKKVALDELAKELNAPLLKRGEKFTDVELANPKRAEIDGAISTGIDGLKSMLSAGAIELKGNHFVANRLDLHEVMGPWHRSFFGRLTKATADFLKYQRDIARTLSRLKESLGTEWRKSLTTLVDHQLMDTSTGELRRLYRKDLLGIAMHVGNESNFEKLAKGMGWEPADIWKTLSDNMTAKDWQAVKTLGEVAGRYWPEQEAMNSRLGNDSPVKIQPRAFMTKFGEMPGWYAPLKYDPIRSALGKKLADGKAVSSSEGLFDRQYFRADTTTNGSLNARKAGYYDYIDLDINRIEGSIIAAVRDLAYREALIDCHKIITHSEVRDQLNRTFGPATQKAMVRMLGQLANSEVGDANQSVFAAKADDQIRSRLISNAIAFRISTIVKHSVTALSTSLSYFRPGTQGAKYFYTRALRVAKNFEGELKEGLAKFPEIQARWDQIQGDVKNTGNLTETDNLREKLGHWGHIGVAYGDLMSALPTAHAMYDLAVNEGIPKKMGGDGKPMTHEDAIAYAQQILREAHGSNLETSKSNLMRDQSKYVKLITMLHGTMNNRMGLATDIVDKMLHAKEANKFDLTLRFATAIFLPEILLGVMGFAGYQQASDDDSLLHRSLHGIADGLLGLIPMGREVSDALEGNVLAPKGGEIPVLSAAKAAGRVIGDSKKLVVDGAKPKHVIKDIGNLVGLQLPGAGQLGSTLQFSYDVYSGDQHPETVGDHVQGISSGNSGKR